jgi:hypothetical protein
MYARLSRALLFGLCFGVACTPSSDRPAAPASFAAQSQALAATALFDTSFHAPRCAASASSCDSGNLLVGRDTLTTTGEAETNSPNTVDGCGDTSGPSGGAFGVLLHYVSAITVSNPSTLPMAPGNTISVTVAAVCASSQFDMIDIYYAASARSPIWSSIATDVVCNVPADGSSNNFTFSTNLTLANIQGDHVVRAIVRHAGAACPCGGDPNAKNAAGVACLDVNNSTDDDDLVFAVGGGVGFSTGPALTTARSGHTATLLSTGDVLVTGGGAASGEVYGLGPQAFASTSPMADVRSSHTATRVTNGKVLVAGGSDGSVSLASTALYDTKTRTFAAGPALHDARESHTSTLLGNGTVLLAGGVQNFSTYLASAELYDPAANKLTSVATGLRQKRNFHTASLLPSGKVLIAGGFDGTHSLASLELFDPSASGFAAISTGALQTGRRGHTATVLNDGTVLIAGGRSDTGIAGSCDLYNPANGQVTSTGSLANARYLHTATLLPDGTVLVTGGLSGSAPLASAELYTPSTRQWTSAGSLAAARYGHTATLLPSAVVLLSGGFDMNNAALASSELNSWNGAPDAAAQPAITGAPTTIAPGQTLTIVGAHLRGLSEASGGGTQNSPSNVPLMLLSGASGSTYLSVYDDSATNASADLPCSTALGSYTLAVVTNGIASLPVGITVTGLQQGATCACSEACQGTPPASQCYASAGSCQNSVCYYPPSAPGGGCDDGNACTRGDQCDGHGGCAGLAYSCTPNQCEATSSCDGRGGCSVTNRGQGVSCNDSDGCTSSDVCDGNGTCGGTAQACGSPPPATCTAARTSRVYNSQAACTPGTGMCSFTYNDIDCGVNTCNPATGLCNGGTNTCAGIACNKPPNTQCFAPTGMCSFGACQYTQVSPGQGCDDGNACTTNDTCNAAGECVGKLASAGTTCDDGNSCTVSDRCDGAGACAGSPLVCNSPSDIQCSSSSGTCVNGACQYLLKTDGTACDDHTACTPTSSCQGGLCVGHNPVVCTAHDPCHDAGACDPGTGQCSTPAKSDGAGCSDGNGCTQNDTCLSGQCVGGAPVVCVPQDACHGSGTCSPATGVCSNPTKADGTGCDDGNACTQGDSCNAGVCVGSSHTTCPPPSACQLPGACDSFSGQCQYASKPNASPCDDGNACTQGDTCQFGTCFGGAPVNCGAPDSCHEAGACDPATGQCTGAAKSDGSSCSDSNACTQTDTCQGGVCTGSDPVKCQPPADTCHDVGICDSTTGACSIVTRKDGSPCNDGDQCTQQDSCQGGACVAGAAVVCKPKDSCHVAGVCDSSTGACSSPAKADQSACDDGNKCTQTDACQAGVCKGTNPVKCAPATECQSAGVCQPETGLCTFAPAADGTQCANGSCKAGACVLSPDLQRKPGGGCHCGSGGQPTAVLLLLVGMALRRRRAKA